MKKLTLVLVIVLSILLSTVSAFAGPGPAALPQLDTESIIDPGYFTVSEYMFGGFVRSSNVAIETYDGIEIVYETPVVLQFSEETTIYLPEGGYYQQSGSNIDIYKQQLNDITIKPTFILNVSEPSMLKLLLAELKRENKKLSSENSLLAGRNSQFALIINSLRTQLDEVTLKFYNLLMGR